MKCRHCGYETIDQDATSIMNQVMGYVLAVIFGVGAVAASVLMFFSWSAS